MFVEVDEMKKLNDRYGQENADLYLQKLSEILRLKSQRSHALSFRRSGDEFFLLARGLTREDVERLAVSIVQAVGKARVGADKGRFTVSIGGTQVDMREAMPINRGYAEKAVKEAKRRGRNQFVWYSDDIEKQPKTFEPRINCTSCRTHASIVMEEKQYDQLQHFLCPVCGAAIPK
ncbi:MAG: hypothetical protein AUJ92_02785 [Armatimonadetes bacterium CG2_30_59_28]|nr:MAG: hypothetical protein AUJ92_02785 [Armatimonadetes bacterium CG2_30_59_28]PIX42752.1 MAG: hypothetical protein COZ56_08615 [Armatimonadetes bacterium CG_4_8_14_3_um_filter_58_9]PJB72441.1 MAG: hypothetical protein CO095_06920 [Armatimonadetes bacterium CG_4_9_14_3_um_filter_58_7]